MTPGSKELHDMALAHFNEPVLLMGCIARVIGYAEDACDCYLIVHSMDRGIYWHTCVGGYIFLNLLKGQSYVKAYNGEDWDDLWRLDNMLELNGVPKAKEFILKITNDDPFTHLELFGENNEH